jgi:hypothetical protein
MRRLDGKPASYKYRNLTGNTFGKLTALYTLTREVGERRFWMCRCECGVEKLIKAHNLTSGETNSCGCAKLASSRANIGIAHSKAVKEGSAFRHLLAMYKNNAKTRGFIWELTAEKFKELTSSPCYYTGTVPSSIVKAQSGEVYTYNGIDRLDNTKGYTLENSVACCGEVNMMKKALSKENFIELCRKITERFSK